MPRKKRSFIDKKKAVKFQVVHRSQRDPLAADNDATQYVLQPVLDPSKASTAQAGVLASVPAELLQMLDEDGDGLEMESGSDYDSQEEEDGYGDEEDEGGDDGDEEEKKGGEGDEELGDMTLAAEDVLLPGEYDYSKHMRPMGQKGAMYVAAPNANAAAAARAQTREVKDESVFFGGIQLEKTLFASDREERVGLLMRGVADAPRFQLPNDVRKALDAAEESDVDEEFDELEDDFVALAMADPDPETAEADEEARRARADAKAAFAAAAASAGGAPALRVEELLDAQDDAELEERKLRMLDEHFERLMTQYADEEIGELEHDDPRVRGHETLEEHEADLDEHLERGRRHFYQPNKPEFEDANQDEIKRKVVARNRVIEAEEGAKPADAVDREIDAQFQPKERSQWDCESIVSTYSTTSNIPRIIREPRKGVAPQIALSKKTGIPLGVLPRRGVAEEAEWNEEDDEEEEERPNLGARRPKKETKEEKAARKQAQKELKRQRRAQKKATKRLYAAESDAEARRVTSDIAAAHGAVRM